MGSRGAGTDTGPRPGRAALLALLLGLAQASPGCWRLPTVSSQPPAHSPLAVQGWAALEAEATGSPLLPGNRVTLLFDGPQTFGAMSAAIASATRSINLETYIFDQDELGLKFADLLIGKQREGVQVCIIYDCVGTLGTPEAFFDRMRAAGIRLCPFHPLNPLRRLGRWRINHRDHRKLLVVDGRIGFTGGANISGTYGHGSLFRHRAGRAVLGWRDTQVRLEGPAVAELQRLFVENWRAQDPRGPQPDATCPPPREGGDLRVRVLGSGPGSDFEIYRAYLLAMSQANRTIHLTSAYFVPDPQLVKALLDAAARGVEVRIILTSVTDSSLVQHASQSHYQALLDGGIQLFQLNSSILHAKTAVIDGRWSTVGSTNLDLRSFLHNREINVVVLGESFGQELESAFQEDLRNSTEIDRAQWASRPEAARIKDWAARILGYWL